MGQLGFEMTDGFLELFLAWNALGKKELTAQVRLAFEQRNLGSDSGVFQGCTEARRTSSHHRDPEALAVVQRQSCPGHSRVVLTAGR